MSKLSDSQRDQLQDSQFGLPDERRYPVPDESHARNAKARAAQQEEAGNLSEGDKAKVDRKADRILED